MDSEITPATVPLKAQIACVIRELALRRTMYPRWIEQRRMKSEAAAKEMAAMQAVLATLTALEAEEARTVDKWSTDVEGCDEPGCKEATK